MAAVRSVGIPTWIGSRGETGTGSMTDKEREVVVRRARKLTYDMFYNTGRLPDYADFRAAFKEVDQRPLSTGSTELPKMFVDGKLQKPTDRK